MAASEAVQKRRKEVFELVQQGVSRDALASKYGITVRAIDKDLTHMRKLRAESGDSISIEMRITEYSESSRQRLSRIWNIITDASSRKRDILQALALLQKEEELRVKRDQMIGILPKEGPMVAIQQNINAREPDYPIIQEMIDIAQKRVNEGRKPDRKGKGDSQPDS